METVRHICGLLEIQVIRRITYGVYLIPIFFYNSTGLLFLKINGKSRSTLGIYDYCFIWGKDYEGKSGFT